MKHQVLDRIFNQCKATRKFERLELDWNFQILDTSKQVQRFATYPEEVILGKDIRLSFPEFIEIENVLISILQGEQELFELKAIRKYSEDNCELCVDIYIIGEPNEKRLIIIFEDVTESVVVEQRLSQKIKEAKLLSGVLTTSKNHIDNVTNSTAKALLVTTKSGKIKKVNRAAIELFGYRQEELINQQVALIIDDNKLLQTSIQKGFFFKEDFQNIEVVCRTKTREKRFISFSCSIIDKKVAGLEDIIYLGRDITLHKRKQQRTCTQYAINKILSESQSVKQAIPQILQAICENIGWDVGELWSSNQYITTSQDSNRFKGRDSAKLGAASTNATSLGNSLPQQQSINLVLRCVEIWSSRTVAVREFKAITWQTTYTPGVGLPGLIWATRSPLWIKDIVDSRDLRQLLGAQPNDGRSQIAAESGLQTALGVPILNNNKILGVMLFFSREQQPQDTDLLQMLVSIGSQITNFIQQK